MLKQGKVWGETIPVLVRPLVSMHLIRILPNAHCSLHSHLHKGNAFVLVSGKVTILTEKVDYALVDETVLDHPGETTTVERGEKHQFKTGAEGAVVLEVYYVDPIDEDDIERASVGGRDE